MTSYLQPVGYWHDPSFHELLHILFLHPGLTTPTSENLDRFSEINHIYVTNLWDIYLTLTVLSSEPLYNFSAECTTTRLVTALRCSRISWMRCKLLAFTFHTFKDKEIFHQTQLCKLFVLLQFLTWSRYFYLNIVLIHFWYTRIHDM